MSQGLRSCIAYYCIRCNNTWNCANLQTSASLVSRRSAPMSDLLARLARTITQHWKRSLGGRRRRHRPARRGRRRRRRGRGRLQRSRAPSPSRRSTSSRRTARPSRAPTPRSSSASRTARSPTPNRARRSPARSARSSSSTASSRSPTRSPRAAPSRPTASWPPSTSATRPTRQDLEKDDGEALLEAAETAEEGGVQVDGARHPDRPRLRAGGAGRRAHRRRRRDHPADAAVPLARGDGRHAGRRAARRDGRPDPAGRARRSRSACPPSRP